MIFRPAQAVGRPFTVAGLVDAGNKDEGPAFDDTLADAAMARALVVSITMGGSAGIGSALTSKRVEVAYLPRTISCRAAGGGTKY